MKFRSTILEPMCMRQFSSIVLTLCKLSKESILRLTNDKLYFIIFDDNSIPRRVLAWCILDQTNFFQEYILEGQSDTNEIYLEFSLELLAVSVNTFKSVDSIKSVKLKLTDKSSPCLTMEIELLTSQGHTRLCVHDVPVVLVSGRQVEEFKELPKYNYDISLEMPNLKMLRNIVDRLKRLNHYMTIGAQGLGLLSLVIETHRVTVATHFRGLTVEKSDDDLHEVSSVRVDLRKLAHFLLCEQINPDVVLCNILHGRLIYLHLKHEDVIINYFLTAIDE